jgi:hypothetical protein
MDPNRPIVLNKSLIASKHFKRVQVEIKAIGEITILDIGICLFPFYAKDNIYEFELRGEPNGLVDF